MLSFALKNLLANKIRSMLALLGLSVAIIGVVTLISASFGLRGDIMKGLSVSHGLVVMRKGALDPVFSRLPVEIKGKSLEKWIESLPGVKVAVAQQWFIEPQIQHGLSLEKGLFSLYAILGQDIDKVHLLTKGGVYGSHMVEGRYLNSKDHGKKRVVISSLIAKTFKTGLGKKINIGLSEYDIIGIFDTGSSILNSAMVIPLDVLLEFSGMRKDVISNYYVEVTNPRMLGPVEIAIEKIDPQIEAVNNDEWMKNSISILTNLDTFLALVSSIAVVVGGIGILNTMLMSVTERVGQFGILRANGWSQKDVIHLIVWESSILGMVGGFLGCFLGLAICRMLTPLLPFELITPPLLLILSFVLAFTMGVLGGVYPAYKAAKMNPMEALRAF